MNKKIFEIGKSIYYKYPKLKPVIEFGYRKFLVKPKFSGWGMSTEHELPWENTEGNQVFQETCENVKKFDFTRDTTGIDKNNVDSLMWRHWIVVSTIKYSIEFANTKNWNFVECGVGDGITSFFALNEISSNIKQKEFCMHLYDAWDGMKEENLLESELTRSGKYSNLSIEKTKKNLDKFKEHLIFHKGYIPESFENTIQSPSEIIYLHIDLNSAKATLETLEYFFPRLQSGGVLLFDDYGWTDYPETKRNIDLFFSDKPGILMQYPTGQAIYFK